LFLNDDKLNDIQISQLDAGKGEDCIYFGAIPVFGNDVSFTVGEGNDFVLIDTNVEVPSNSVKKQVLDLDLGAGDDILIQNGHPGFVDLNIFGEAGSDAIILANNAVARDVDAGDGDDLVIVDDKAQADDIFGNYGDDFLNLKGSAFVAHVFGDEMAADGQTNANNDGRDVIIVEEGVHINLISGNGNDDEIDVYAPFEYVFGDDGNDYIYIASSIQGATVSGGDGDDFVVIKQGALLGAVYLGSGDDYLYADSGVIVEFINAGFGDDDVDFAGTAEFINLYNGDDDFVLHEDGKVFGDLEGYEGNDEILVRGFVFSNVDGGAGDDTIDIADKARVAIAFGSSGDDYIKVSGFAGFVYGNEDNDNIVISSKATIYGYVAGNSGDDNIEISHGAKVQGLVSGGTDNDVCVVPKALAVDDCTVLEVFSSSSPSSS